MVTFPGLAWFEPLIQTMTQDVDGMQALYVLYMTQLHAISQQ